MSKEKKLIVGNYESARAFLDALSTSVDIPCLKKLTALRSKSS